MYILIQYQKRELSVVYFDRSAAHISVHRRVKFGHAYPETFYLRKSFFNRNEYPVCYILYQTRTYLHFRLHYAVHRRIIHRTGNIVIFSRLTEICFHFHIRTEKRPRLFLFSHTSVKGVRPDIIYRYPVFHLPVQCVQPVPS